MKKILLVALLGLFALAGFAQEQVYYDSHPTLAWNAVTEDADGNPFLPEDVIEYEVYLWDSNNGDVTVQPLTSLTYYGTTTATELQLSFPYRANWVAAIRVVHTDGGGNVTYSDLAYTTEEVPVTLAGPFVYVPGSAALPRVQGLRDSGTQ